MIKRYEFTNYIFHLQEDILDDVQIFVVQSTLFEIQFVFIIFLSL